MVHFPGENEAYSTKLIYGGLRFKTQKILLRGMAWLWIGFTVTFVGMTAVVAE
jgi:hypothetical protein